MFPVASVSVGIVVNVLAEGAAVVRAVEAAPLAVPVPAAEDAVAVRVQVAVAVPLAAAAQAGAAGVAAVAVALVAGYKEKPDPRGMSFLITWWYILAVQTGEIWFP